MKGAEHRCLGAAGGFVVVHRHREHGQAQRVGQQDELLALVVALLAGGGEELNARHPFGFGELDLARKGVQVLHQAGHDLLQTRVRRLRQAREHGLGDVVLIEVSQRLSPVLLRVVRSAVTM
ncbi:hypothetical protein D9M68_941420 [compost metagenome]